MATIRDILHHKGTQIHTISPRATALDAAMLMNEHKIGALLVLDNDRLVGIITERDVLRKVVAQRQDPAHTHVQDIMTSKVICCHDKTTIEEVRSIFMSQRIRHLPVVAEQGQVAGMVSIGDLNAWQLDGQEQTIHYLQEYLYGYAS